jgi:hypothetical protein
MKRLLLGAAKVGVVLIVVLVAAVLGIQHFSDGPKGPISGGPLRAGELVTAPVSDWSFAEGKVVELELAATGQSRTTGSLVYEGQFYVPCDLGFVWRRLPSAAMRGIASILWAVKHWHEDAMRDGRAVVRIDGVRYEGKLVRVTDPELLAKLRAIMQDKAAKYMHATLTDAPADTEAIWFFRLDPR